MNPATILARTRAVVFDVGETLVDESRMWATEASRCGVSPFALMGVLGALIARGDDHRHVWEVLGVDRPVTSPSIEADDLYPDALECLRAARRSNLVVGIAGNQPAGAEAQLRAAGFEADFVASSSGWDVAKPSAEFFARVVAAAQVDPGAILYVGDRVDNDIVPARAAGMSTAFIRRGPWGYIHAQRPESELADLHIDSLAELTAAMPR